jgi:hypothetical protein
MAGLATCALLGLASAAADGMRDPMRPPLPENRAAAAREAAPVLSAIMGRSGARSAIFNGQLVRSGSSVGSYTIEAVLDDGVRFRHAGESHELRLIPTVSSFKKPAATTVAAPSGAH